MQRINIKRTSLFAILTLSLLLLTLSISPVLAQSPNTPETDAYDFPISPGTDEWRALKTHDEMLEVTQIPEDILNNMSTAGLVETVLDYPLLVDIMAYSSVQQGFDQVASHFNGLSELLDREDAGEKLLARYRNIDAGGVKREWPLLRQGEYVINVYIIEFFLTQEHILDTFTEAELQELVNIARVQYTEKQEFVEIYGSSGLKQTSEVLEHASARGYSARWYTDYVYTPNTTAVLVYVGFDNWTPAEIEYWNEETTDTYPLATFVSDSSKKYNCHSYAWYYQSASNIAWMNNPSAYWTDGSFTEISGANAYPGIKMYYNTYYAHSAVFLGYPLYGLYTSISKWGQLPLMEHDPWYSPYDYSDINYYELD